METLPTSATAHQIRVEKEGISSLVDLSNLHTLTGAPYIPHLEFSSYQLLKKITRKQKKKLPPQRLWLSAYFKDEILNPPMPPVYLQWIDAKMGWGIFADKDIPTMEFIAEYSGKVRPRGRNDAKNAYCFEYLLAPDEETPYLIDAQDQGGLSRYINHHPKPNLSSTFVLIDNIPHIILYTAKPIKKDEQLSYDYGVDYWKHRPKPHT